jgi:hypothetical protein
MKTNTIIFLCVCLALVIFLAIVIPIRQGPNRMKYLLKRELADRRLERRKWAAKWDPYPTRMVWDKTRYDAERETLITGQDGRAKNRNVFDKMPPRPAVQDEAYIPNWRQQFYPDADMAG